MAAKKKAPASKEPPKAKDLQVVYREVTAIKPDPRNARKHSPQQVAELRASLRQFGFTNPILLRPDGTIGAGHGRLEAAIAEGMAKVPTITLDLTPDQWRAYAIADNKIPLGATWDLDILGAELEAINASGLDLVGLGFEAFAEELSPSGGAELEAGGKTGTRISQTVIQFNIVFDNEDQQGKWFQFVRDLKAKYPDEPSLAARLVKFLAKAKV